MVTQLLILTRESTSCAKRASPFLVVLVSAAVLFFLTACGDQQTSRQIPMAQVPDVAATFTLPVKSGPTTSIPPGIPTVEDKGQVPPPVPSVEPTSTRPSVLPQYKDFCSSGLPWPYPPPESGSMAVPASDFVKQGSFGIWCYEAMMYNGELTADISYDKSTRAALEAFAAENRNLAGELAAQGGRARVLVMFRNAEKPSWFRAWATSKRIWVDSALIRAMQSSPMPGAWGWANGTRDDPLADHHEGEEEQRGVIGLWGTMDAGRLPEVASDSSVFLADVTFTVVFRDLAEAGLIKAGSGNPDSMYGVGMLPWLSELPVQPMEELGIYSFDKP